MAYKIKDSRRHLINMLLVAIVLTAMIIFSLWTKSSANKEDMGAAQQKPTAEQHISVPLKRISAGGIAPRGIAWSADSEYLAAVSGLGRLRVLNVKGDTLLDKRVICAIGDLKFSPNGDLLAYTTCTSLEELHSGKRPTTAVYDVKTGEFIQRNKDVSPKFPWVNDRDYSRNELTKNQIKSLESKTPANSYYYPSGNGYVMVSWEASSGGCHLELYRDVRNKPIWSYELKPQSAISKFLQESWEGAYGREAVTNFRWSPDGDYFAFSYWRGIDESQFWIAGPLTNSCHN